MQLDLRSRTKNSDSDSTQKPPTPCDSTTLCVANSFWVGIVCPWWFLWLALSSFPIMDQSRSQPKFLGGQNVWL